MASASFELMSDGCQAKDDLKKIYMLIQKSSFMQAQILFEYEGCRITYSNKEALRSPIRYLVNIINDAFWP